MTRLRSSSAMSFVMSVCLLVAASAGCATEASTPKTSAAQAGTIAFEPLGAPVTDTAKRRILVSPSVTLNGAVKPIGYNVLMRSGDVIGGQTFGLIHDQRGRAVVEKDGSSFVSNDNDFSSLLQIDGKLFNITHFESRPGAMYLTELHQDKTTGALTAVRTRNIDFASWGGLWVPCAGSVTPWNTHLGSEEYPPNARAVEQATATDQINEYYKPMLRYFGIRDPFDKALSLNEIKAHFNPYRYGYPVEVTVRGDFSASVAKRMAMGRLAVELAYAMPDRKTVYISDDGENVGLFLFIADHAGELNAGRLYAAQWIQRHAENGGAADIAWIDLGHANQDEIMAAVDKGIRFSDIFESSDPTKPVPAGFTSINAYDGDGAATEVLRLKPGMEKIASRLETRRYAAMLGATVEFRKEEGIAYDPAGKMLYVAMSEINRGMEDNRKNGKESDKFDRGGPNHIRLPYNETGCVYGLGVGPHPRINSDFVASEMHGVLCGEMLAYPPGSPFAGNTANVDKIANPDNLTFLPGYKTLIIGEDSGSGHQNDAIWAYHVEHKTLTRIETTPYGSETTSPYFYPDLNGWSYIMSVVQHPYGESDTDKLADPSDARAYVGYIGPLPAMK